MKEYRARRVAQVGPIAVYSLQGYMDGYESADHGVVVHCGDTDMVGLNTGAGYIWEGRGWRTKCYIGLDTLLSQMLGAPCEVYRHVPMSLQAVDLGMVNAAIEAVLRGR